MFEKYTFKTSFDTFLTFLTDIHFKKRANEFQLKRTPFNIEERQTYQQILLLTLSWRTVLSYIRNQFIGLLCK